MTPDIDKLERWAAHLETPEVAEHFDMASWAEPGFVGATKSCQSTACALGHATTIFPELQLRNIPGSDWVDVVLVKDGEPLQNFVAAIEFFGITWNEADRVCSPEEYEEIGDDDDPVQTSYITPQMVAARIREIIAKHRSKS